MHTSVLHFSRSIALSLTVGLLAATGMAGCSSEAPDEGAAVAGESDVKHVLIGAADVEALAPGQNLFVDLGVEKVVYHFQVNKPIDFSRIKLVSKEKAEGAMEVALAQMQEDGLDVLSSANGRFLIAAEASSFVELTDVDRAELDASGVLTKDATTGATQPQPQTEDECTEHTVYNSVVVVIDGESFTYTCVHTEIVCP